ncbi:MAG: DUF4410 domain-containing protein [Candidatus Acidiferrales bacterium]
MILLLIPLFAVVTAAHAAPHRQQEAKKLSKYKVIVVKPFTVEKSPSTKNFPSGLESALQNGAVAKLRAAALFEAVISVSPRLDAEPTAIAPLDLRINAVQPVPPDSAAGKLSAPEAPSHGRRLILNGTVVSFSSGNRAVRYLGGFGAGESKLKVRFTLVDAKTGDDVMSWDQTGTFKGMFSPFGGSSGKAGTDDAGSVIKGLLKKIEENR